MSDVETPRSMTAKQRREAERARRMEQLAAHGLADVADRLPRGVAVDETGRVGVRRKGHMQPTLWDARTVLVRIPVERAQVRAQTPPRSHLEIAFTGWVEPASTAPAPPALRTQLDIAFREWERPRSDEAPPLAPARPAKPRTVRLPVTDRADRAATPWIGPDAAKPCEGCSRRKGCSAPCEALERVVGIAQEYRSDPHHVSSEALMQGRGYDPQFMTIPDELRVDEGEPLWPKLVALYGGERLKAAMEGPKPLTKQQALCVELALRGMDRKSIAVRYLALMEEIGRHDATATRRGFVTRQTICKVTGTGLKVLRANLGPAPSRADLEDLPDLDEDDLSAEASGVFGATGETDAAALA